MAIEKKNTYVIGSNNDLTNALLNIDLNRVGGDLTYLVNDSGTLKVEIGSLIEANGSVYSVTSRETPTGTPADGTYLFFNPAGPSFVWSATPGTYDAALGGLYDGSARRQCRFRLKSATTWDIVLAPESPDLIGVGNLRVTGAAYRACTLINTTVQDTAFIALSPYCKTVGDHAPVSGTVADTGASPTRLGTIFRVYRRTTTAIDIYVNFVETGGTWSGPAIYIVNSGGGAIGTGVSITATVG